MKTAPYLRNLPKYNIGVHFLTAKTFKNTPYLGDSRCALIFCEELESASARYSFHVLAFVVMPDHVHLLLWWDPEALPGLTISKIAWAVKGLSARQIVDCLKRAEDNVGVGDCRWVTALPSSTRIPTRRPCFNRFVGQRMSLITGTGATRFGEKVQAMTSISTRSTNFWKRRTTFTRTRYGYD